MSMTTDEARPRAYYPEGTDSRPPTRRTPGWDVGPERRIDDGRSLARALGWFSIGLGLFQIVAPGRLTDFLGLDEDREALVRLFGGREVAQGIAILAERTPTAGVWSRVGGDALDLAALGATLRRGEPRRDHVVMAIAMVAGVALLDAYCARQLSGGPEPAGAGRSR